MRPQKPYLFVSAGEYSGRRLAEATLAELQSQGRDCEVSYLAGTPEEVHSGKALALLSKTARAGITDILTTLPFFLDLYFKTRKTLERRRPDLVLLVDYPGFNQPLMKWCHRQGLPVFYLAPPQAWAYRSRNLEAFRDRRVHVLLPLEVEPYERAGAIVTQGHFLNPVQIEKQKTLYLLCPGSRWPAVRRNLPLFIRAMRNMSGKEYLAPALLAPPYLKEACETWLKTGSSTPIRVYTQAEECLPVTRFAIAFPGTITLELAHWKIPTLVLGKVDSLTYRLGKTKIGSPWLSWPNVLAGSEIFPEWVHYKDPDSRTLSKMFHKLFFFPESAWSKLPPLNTGKGAALAASRCRAMLQGFGG